MKNKQYIAAVICLVAGIIGFGSVYATRQVEKIKQESNQVAQEEDERKQGQPDSRQSASNDSQLQPHDAAKPDDTVKADEEPAASASTVVPPKSNELPQGVIEMDVDMGSEEVPEEKEEQTQPTAVVEEALHFTQEQELVWPLEGNVLLNYSMDSTIYFPTLDQYRYNPALVIGGAVNDKVYLVADGIITDIYTSEETGCTVVQDLGDGYTAIYGQLKELNFEVGERVQRGQVIGYVSEPTKYYSLEGNNLYFELQKDNEPVNPLDYFQ